MKPNYLILFLLCFASTLYSQQNNKRPFSLVYGKRFLQEHTFNELNTLDRPSLKGPMNILGFEVGVKRFFIGPGNKHILYAMLGFTMILPTTIQLNDSTKAKLSGYQGEALLIGKDFRTKRKKAGAKISLGANMGYVTLKKGKELRLMNYYISPLLSFRPWVVLKPVRLGLICEYEYDVSNKNWKPIWWRKKAPNLAKPDKFSSTGLCVYFTIGVNIL
jgi:hypothetical protein